MNRPQATYLRGSAVALACAACASPATIPLRTPTWLPDDLNVSNGSSELTSPATLLFCDEPRDACKIAGTYGPGFRMRREVLSDDRSRYAVWYVQADREHIDLYSSDGAELGHVALPHGQHPGSSARAEWFGTNLLLRWSAGSDDAFAILWDQTGQELLSVAGVRLAFSPTGARVVVLHGSRHLSPRGRPLEAYDLVSARRLRDIPLPGDLDRLLDVTWRGESALLDYQDASGGTRTLALDLN